ncbi:MAG: tetratricopeptide repeat protein [Candidatus Gastranaerophilales bacterium]|nr:tetratricopeptide repeat protein [Candidatus Gastranaerophilales bacterium]
MKNKIIILLVCLIMIMSSSFAEETAPPLVPTDAKLEYNHGIDCYKLGQYDEAIAAFRTAIRLYPDYIDAYYNLGSLLEYLKQNDEALAIFEQIIARNHKEYEALYKAAKLSALLGDRITAAKYISMIPKSSPFAAKAASVSSLYHLTPATGANNGNPASSVSQTGGCYPNITSPTGITSDSYGNLYVSSFTDNAIIKILPDGKKMLFYKSPNLKGPISLASDSMGNIYVANYNANNILKLSHSGACTVLTTNVSKPYGVHVNGNILFVACQGTNSVLRVKLK